MLGSNIYKLDQALYDMQGKQRAHSSYGRKTKRSLASQLKYNDRMLLRGITGSPLPLQTANTATSPVSLNPHRVGMVDQSTNPTTALVILDD